MLLKVGWPAEDRAGYVDGEAHPIALAEDGWSLRPYQRQAVEGFWHGGSGVVVLPCGAGKTAPSKATCSMVILGSADKRPSERMPHAWSCAIVPSMLKVKV